MDQCCQTSIDQFDGVRKIFNVDYDFVRNGVNLDGLDEFSEMLKNTLEDH